MSKKEDSVFFQNYSIVLGLLAVMIVAFILIARAVGTDDEEYVAKRTDQTASLTKPAGQVVVEGQEDIIEASSNALAEPEVAEVMEPGQKTYSGLCASCHSNAFMKGVPQFGDAAAWTERQQKGIDALYANAINGFTGESGIPMPAKGGNPTLTDEEVKTAVDYMIANSQ